MNLTSLILWATGIITALAGTYNIDVIHKEILKAQAKLIYESRTETWGSPKFLNNDLHSLNNDENSHYERR